MGVDWVVQLDGTPRETLSPVRAEEGEEDMIMREDIWGKIWLFPQAMCVWILWASPGLHLYLNSDCSERSICAKVARAGLAEQCNMTKTQFTQSGHDQGLGISPPSDLQIPFH